MNWNYPLTNLEYWFITIFIGLYLLYIARTLWAAHTLKTTSRSVVLKFFLRIIYFGLLILSLLGPFFGEQNREIVAEGKDIFFMVDVSKSMDATDIQPSRLEKVKFELQQFVNVLPENRYGLIVFASDAYLQVPLTFDINALTLFLQSLSTNQISNAGTDICSALELAVHKEIGNENAAKTTKILVLLSDGENFGSCDKRLLALIKQYGIHLVIVGVGTKTGIELLSDGKPLKDENNQTVVGSLKSDFLLALATQSGGSYFEINEKTSDMAAVVQAIQGFENKLIDTKKVIITSNKYKYFLLMALALMVLDILVTVTTFQL